MFKSKKIVLCSVMCVMSASAHGPQRFPFPPHHTSEGIDGIGVTGNRSSESAEKIMDAYMRVAFSEKSKKRNEVCMSAIGQLISANTQAFAEDFMNELDPQDAQKLLPLLYNLEVLANEALEVAPRLEHMNASELDELGAEWAMKLMPLFLQIAEYAPAFEKQQEALKRNQEVSKAELMGYATKILDSFRAVREIVEAKVRS